jgi:ABC-2 type transport system permease protein
MIDLGKVFWIARLNLLRQVRDRGDLFALVVVPTIIIIAIALQFSGGSRARIGVFAPAGDRGADAVVAALRSEPSRFDVRLIPDEATLRSQVEHGLLEAGLVIPDGFEAALRGDATATIRFLGTPTSLTAGVRAPIEASLARVGAIATASRVAVVDGAGDWDAVQAAAEAGYGRVAGLRVELTEVGEPGLFAGFSGFAVGATTQLILFVFLTSMTRSTRLVATKRLGLSRRMLATPTSAWTVVAGETAGRFAVAMLQAAYIVVGTAVVFGVSWGDPLATGALIALFGLVAAGAAMLVGAVSTNESQAQSRGAFFGLALAALGGCMIPFQAMSADMQALARLVPHTWAVLGIQSVIGGNGGLASVLPEVAVLAGYATVLVLLAGWQFRRAITGGALAQEPAARHRRFRRLRRRLSG